MIPIVNFSTGIRIGNESFPKNSLIFSKVETDSAIRILFLNKKTYLTADWHDFVDDTATPYDTIEEVIADLELSYSSSGGSGATTFSELTDAYNLSSALFGTVPMRGNDGNLFAVNIFESTPVSVDAATTAALAGTWNYSNGASGVGATLTRTTNGAVANIDGVVMTAGKKVLHKNWTGVNRIRNGVWILTVAGNGSTAAVWTRATDSDETIELDGQNVIPSAGTTNKRIIFSQTTTAPVIGTSIIVYQNTAVATPSVAPTSITVVAARALITAGSVVIGRVYSITDSASLKNSADRIWITGSGPDDFDFMSARYIDSVNNVRNNIWYLLDGSNDVIVFREDTLNNRVYDLTGAVIKNQFPWGNTNWQSNTFISPSGISGTPGNNIFVGNYFEAGSGLDINTISDGIYRNNKILGGTILDLLQDQMIMINNVWKSNGAFTFTSSSFFDIVLDNDIRTINGAFTSGAYFVTSQMINCHIWLGNGFDLVEIINSTYQLTNRANQNNILSSFDMSDTGNFNTGILTPNSNNDLAKHFLMTGNNNVIITSIQGQDRLRFYAADTFSYTFRHVAIGSFTGTELIRSAGAGDDVIVGRTLVQDFVEYERITGQVVVQTNKVILT